MSSDDLTLLRCSAVRCVCTYTKICPDYCHHDCNRCLLVL